VPTLSLEDLLMQAPRPFAALITRFGLMPGQALANANPATALLQDRATTVPVELSLAFLTTAVETAMAEQQDHDEILVPLRPRLRSDFSVVRS
jgi:hypothetical protein